jgi:dephospho-CoA kinase
VSKRWSDKYIVGLTGNIATGKSAVLELAAAQDTLAIDADQIVHDLLDNDSAVQEAIEAAFGSALRRPDGRINRERLGAIVFSDESLLAILESIVHPAVNRNLLRTIDESDAIIVFIEAIKLLESSLLGECDQVWVTRCSMEVQVGRLMTYRGMDRQTAMNRVAAQPPQVEKVAAADVVIDTEGSMADTVRLFDIAWQKTAGGEHSTNKPG